MLYSWYSLVARTSEEPFAGSWTAEIRIREGGTYTFTCKSTDGSKVYINDELVVDNDG